MKFILDGMLGKLARWLRMMGHDVKYSTMLSDSELLAVAKIEKRILLTRDFALYQQAISKRVETYYVEGETETVRLSEISGRFGLPLIVDMKKSRCPKCNEQLVSASKQEIADKAEKNTLLYYEEFWRCLHCGAVYWQGAHWAKIRSTLEEAKKATKK